jgi:hypothetical protein
MCRDWPLELEPTMVDGSPLWPQIYLCLRCGDVAAAAAVARAAPGSTGDTAALLDAYGASLSGTLPQALWTRAVAEYNSFARAGAGAHGGGSSRADPFKIAVYTLLARVDISHVHELVTPTTQDYLWYQLRLVTSAGTDSVPVPAALAAHSVSIEEIRASLLAVGPDHFGGGLLWFVVLVTVGLFPRALAHLAARGGHEALAVHVAIYLAHFGAIRDSSASIVGGGGKGGGRGGFAGIGDLGNDGAPVFEEGDNPAVNVARLVLWYVRSHVHPLHRVIPYALVLRGEAVVERALAEIGSWNGNYAEMLGIDQGSSFVDFGFGFLGVSFFFFFFFFFF